jgi:hypothetical protein
MAVAPAGRLRAYVDETGDRGHSATSSPFFAFAAVIVADEDEAPLRAAMSRLRLDMGVPPGRALHWKDHVKSYGRRQHVAELLSAVPGVTVAYVLVEKAWVHTGSALKTDHVVFYNYAAGIMMERLLLAAQGWPGGARDIIVTFGHVRRLDHTTTTNYFGTKRAASPTSVPWHLLHGQVRFTDQTSWDGSKRPTSAPGC